MKFRIVTPCSRPENLLPIYQSIQGYKSKSTHDVEWIIVFDRPIPEHLPDLGDTVILWIDLKGKSVVGHQQRNLALDAYTDGYIYFLDDDNILHPNFHLIEPFLRENVLILDQSNKKGKRVRVARQRNIRVGKIDTAQYIVYRPLVKNERFLLVYEADGMFISELYNFCYEKFLYLNTPQGLCYYNYLR